MGGWVGEKSRNPPDAETPPSLAAQLRPTCVERGDCAGHFDRPAEEEKFSHRNKSVIVKLVSPCQQIGMTPCRNV